MTLDEILLALQSGRPLSKEQSDYLVDSLGKVSAGKVPPTEKDKTSEQLEKEILGAMDALRSTPEGQKQLKESIAERRTQRYIKRYTPFFNAMLAGADIATSLKQVRESKDLLRNLNRPSMPSIPGIDPALDSSIRDAQRGTMDAARAVAPMRQDLEDQYNKDIALAKSIGGGQASTVGALGQVASLRRARGIGSMAPIIDDVRAREQGRLDGLVNQRSAVTQQNYQNRLGQAKIGLEQYGEDARAIGALGAAGRMNLRNSASSLLNAVPGVAARVGQGYGDKYGSYEQSLNNSLLNKPRSNGNPFSSLDSNDDSKYFFNY